MKLFLEEETDREIDGKLEKTISKIKEVSLKSDAIKDKTANKCYLHTCHHDTPDKDGNYLPCTREAL